MDGGRADTAAPMRAPLVGRAEELAELQRAAAALSEGRGALFLVTGEPGIGKTRVCEELGHLATGSGVRVLWGRCHETGGRPPYWPWAQIIQACARHVIPPEHSAEYLPDPLPIEELVEELRPKPKTGGTVNTDVDPEAARFRLFE